MPDAPSTAPAAPAPPTEQELAALRLDVRAFVEERRAAGDFAPVVDPWVAGFSADFSRALAARGWVASLIPAEYGGPGRSFSERLVIAEELLAAGAPVAAHWIAERQMAPAILKHGTEELRRELLPGIAAGERYFAIGMSEPDSGSDLASVKTRARRSDGGWTINGAKVWTTLAHKVHTIGVLCRTSEEQQKHAGLSQILVDLDSPGVEIRPIPTINSAEGDFCEVIFEDVEVPAERLLGTPGDGWRQVLGELGYERNGAERYLSPFPLLDAFARAHASGEDERATQLVGELVSELVPLRRMAWRIAREIDAGIDPADRAAEAKDAGTVFEQSLIERIRAVAGVQTTKPYAGELERLLAEAVLAGPSFTLRGGTTEILRGIVGRRLASGR